MSKSVIIKKASGEKEAFDPDKLRNSLKRAGTGEDTAEEIVSSILPTLSEGMTTKEIYRKAFGMLRKRKSSDAARYSLKNAIMELGPTGYPFEQFVAQVLVHHGFEVKVGEVLQGKCVTHEVDIVADFENTQYLVECKFYNSPGKYCNVRVPLYVRSRVDDIIQFREKTPKHKNTRFFGWVVTNTRFTEDAVNYGRCAGLHMLSWSMPKNKALKDMVEEARVFPITVLTNLTKKQKEFLLSKDIVLCRQLKEKPGVLNETGITSATRKKILTELDELIANSKD
ncbi:MAG: ATP-binding protein [Bacteroidetes bacterium]|nr:MAG: ATP-binding protein [Bacteroidota bacterium]